LHNLVSAYTVGVIKRTSLNLDLDLIADARDILGTNGTTDTVHRALEDVVRRQHLRELAKMRFEDLTPEALVALRRTRTERWLEE
jgi:Arc/MetJ family transcription regulator